MPDRGNRLPLIMPPQSLRLAALLGSFSFLTLAAFAQERPPSPVVVSPVVNREVQTGQTFVGSIVPERRATVGSAVNGRVVSFPINEGDRVEAKQALAELLTETIQLELEAAEAELRLRREELAELENGSRPEEIAQAKAQMDAAKAALDYSEKRYSRVEKLVREGNAATDEQLDIALSELENARALHNERVAAHQLAVAGPRAERIAQARARVAIQEANVQQLKDRIKKHTIISRFAGYVVAEHTEEGAWVNQGDPVAEIVALDKVDALAYVLESQVAHVQPGSEARVDVPALPELLFTGAVEIVIPQGDARSRTFPVKVRLDNVFENDRPLLKSGMLARVTLPTGRQQQSLLVAKDALVLGGPKPLVYVVDAKKIAVGETGSVRPVPLELGVAVGSLVQVIGDLKEGEFVVILGNERLRPGQGVKVQRIVESVEGKSTEVGVADQTDRR